MNDKHETPARIEPCLLDETGPEIVDLVARLSASSSKLGSRLHPRTASSLADAVRIMNCYYSNLIEGHNTTPREIERALANQLAVSEERRNLQVEARAHINLQHEIDAKYAAGTLGEPASVAFISWLHRSFYHGATPTMLTVMGAGRELLMVPGEFRSTAEHEVAVGRHLPPSGQNVASFMTYFENRYRFESLGMGQSILAMAAAHHRLNYIHPFLDGNGRVSRLMSHAIESWHRSPRPMVRVPRLGSRS
jgi:Fic family protein